MTEPPDPLVAAAIAELRSLTAALRASLAGRTLSAAEWASLQPIVVAEAELRTTLVFDLEADDGAAVRRVLGSAGEGRA